jgi:fumarate reductase subunit D
MRRFLALRSTLVALAAVSATLLWAPKASAEPGDDLTIYALTFGPGDHPFFKFGHNAIWVQPRDSQGLVYNFGTFAFDSPALIPKFLRGKFMYWLSVSGFDDTVESYASANRSILAQELDLTPEQRVRLWQALRLNARPENREYLYDYFYDNCSTRVRDAIDRVVGGRVHLAGSAPSQMTFRQHAMRMTADLWPEAAGIDLAIGPSADKPIDRWDEAFLPERLAALLRTVRIPGVEGEKDLVKAEKIIFQDKRPPEPARPPSWTAYFLLVGLVTGGLLFGLGRLGRSTLARILLGMLTSLLGAVLGLLGLALLLLWVFTNHRIAYTNANIIQFAPWAVVLLVYGVGVALWRTGAVRGARLVALSAAIFSLIGLFAKVLPGLTQSNWPFIALCLPFWTGLWAGLRALSAATQTTALPKGQPANPPKTRVRRGPADAA